MAKDESVIPKGLYCYKIIGMSDRSFPLIEVCPYWELVEDKPEQLNGYCHYLEKGDWESKCFGLLWDQVKGCGINDEWDEDDIWNGEEE